MNEHYLNIKNNKLKLNLLYYLSNLIFFLQLKSFLQMKNKNKYYSSYAIITYYFIIINTSLAGPSLNDGLAKQVFKIY